MKFEELLGKQAELSMEYAHGNGFVIDVIVERVTQKAVLLRRVDGDIRAWFPRKTLSCRNHPNVGKNEIDVWWWANYYDREDIQNFLWQDNRRLRRPRRY